MIFDSTKMKKLRKKFAGLPLNEVPTIVKLDNLDEYKNERIHLEDLISKINGPKQRDLIKKLVNSNEGQHVGAWFELMLFGWLLDNFIVEVEPNIEDCYPDFRICFNGLPIAIEAKASLISKKEKAKQQTEKLIFSSLHEVPYPYWVFIEVETISEKICKEKLIHDVTCWLHSGGSQPLLFDDEFGNKFTLIKGMKEDTQYLRVGISRPLCVNLKKLMKGLNGKANQHIRIHQSRIPYVIAIYLESNSFSDEDIISAWFGKPAVIIDRNRGEIIGNTIDKTGVQFAKSNNEQVVHQGVSGLLAFSVKRNTEMKTRELIASYIQTPFAINPIATDIFPVASRFIVTSQDELFFNMKWVDQ